MEAKVSTDTPSTRKLLFIAGRISLDFSHTGGKRTERAAFFEVLHAPVDFSHWLAQSSLAVDGIHVTEAELALAHELREAIWYAAHAVVYGKQIDELDREIINRHAASDAPVLQLSSEGSAHWEQPLTVKMILSYIARDAIELLGTNAKARLRECANPRCPLLFVDTSRPNKRRWCSMERCGLAEKTARFRNKSNAR